MNVHGETTKPVENIRWEKNKAPAGHYRVYVQNYAFHGGGTQATPFRVEIEINGQIQHFEGKTPANKTHEDSNTLVHEFDYVPENRKESKKADAYAMYEPSVVIAQWSGVLPSEHILVIEDPKAVVDVILGVLAIENGGLSLEQYVQEMKSRDQTDKRCDDVSQALGGLSADKALPKVSSSQLPKKKAGPATTRGSKTKRL
jgi:hypothetical protein